MLEERHDHIDTFTTASHATSRAVQEPGTWDCLQSRELINPPNTNLSFRHALRRNHEGAMLPFVSFPIHLGIMGGVDLR